MTDIIIQSYPGKKSVSDDSTEDDERLEWLKSLFWPAHPSSFVLEMDVLNLFILKVIIIIILLYYNNTSSNYFSGKC